MVKEGRYQGFGFIDKNEQVTSIEDYEPFIKLQEATYHTHKILSNYMRKQGSPRVIFFDNPDERTAVAKRAAGKFREVAFEMRFA